MKNKNKPNGRVAPEPPPTETEVYVAPDHERHVVMVIFGDARLAVKPETAIQMAKYIQESAELLMRPSM
jgi:hypothetical protein